MLGSLGEHSLKEGHMSLCRGPGGRECDILGTEKSHCVWNVEG